MFNFAKRKNVVDVGRMIRRIRDITIPNSPLNPNPERRQERSNRAIPTLICPWEDDEPLVHAATFALTRDVSDFGVGLVTNEPIEVECVLIGYWPDGDDPGQPWFFLGEAKRLESIGGGFWTLGVEFQEFVNQTYSSQLAALMPKARELRPVVEEPLTV